VDAQLVLQTQLLFDGQLDGWTDSLPWQYHAGTFLQLAAAVPARDKSISVPVVVL